MEGLRGDKHHSRSGIASTGWAFVSLSYHGHLLPNGRGRDSHQQHLVEAPVREKGKQKAQVDMTTYVHPEVGGAQL